MSDSTDPPDDYEVGYRKPPRHTQFRPGQSGNPKGRPKGTRNLKTDLSEVLGRRVNMREGDRSLRVSMQQAMLMALAARALKGDVRAANLLVSMIMRLLETSESEFELEEPLSESESEILRAFEDRVRRQLGEGEDPGSSSSETEDPS